MAGESVVKDRAAGAEIAATLLLNAYKEEVGKFLLEQDPASHGICERAAELLDRTLKGRRRLSAGFLGEAQVGKSTLINALVGRKVLPAGGIGPLTAKATRVAYAEAPYFRVTYHGRKELNQLLMPLVSHVAREENGRDATEENGEEEDTSEERNTVHYMLDQARKMFQPSASELPPADKILLDCMRAVLGHEVLSAPEDLAPYRMRIEEIKHYIEKKEEEIHESNSGVREFYKSLRLRASGWLAPLVASLEVFLDAEIVKRIGLTDLPGIGVFADAAERAGDFVRREADALVLVMRNAGLPEVLVQLLEESGVITKLLFGGEESVAPIHVSIAITHLDDVARERHAVAREEAEEEGLPVPKRDELFRQLAHEMESTVRRQLEQALLRSEAFAELTEEAQERRRTVIERLCRGLDIVCVSARDYLELEVDSDETFVKDPETTGIPRLRAALERLAQDADLRWRSTVLNRTNELGRAIAESLESLRAVYASQGARFGRDWTEFRNRLETECQQLESEMKGLHGAALEFLVSGMPERIKLVCREAAETSQRSLRRLLKNGRELRWASLNAALRRNGVWERRNINYPRALTGRFVDAIASSWESQIVSAVHEKVQKMAEHDQRLVDRLCEFASDYDATLVTEAQIAAQKRLLHQSAETCVRWTDEELTHLRERVHAELYAAVQEPFAAACEEALRVGRNRGRGARDEILDCFEEAGERAVRKAESAAEKCLRSQYEKLLNDLQRHFAANQNPVRAAFEALTSENLGEARRADLDRQRAILERCTALRDKVRSLIPGSPVMAEAATTT